MSPQDVARIQEEEKQLRLRASLNAAQPERDPNRVALASKLASQFGVPPPVVESDPAPFQQMQQRSEADQHIENHPWMAPVLADNPDLGAMTTPKDLKTVGSIGSTIGASKPFSFSDLLSSTASTILKYGTALVNPSQALGRYASEQGQKLGEDTLTDFRQSGVSGGEYATRYARAAPGQVGLGVMNTAHGIEGMGEMVTSLASAAVGADDPLYGMYRKDDQIAAATTKLYTPDWVKTDFQKGVLSGMQSITQMAVTAPLGAGRSLLALSGISAGQAEDQFRERGAGVVESAAGAAATGALEYGTERYLGGYGEGGYLHSGSFLHNFSPQKFLHFVRNDLLGEEIATASQDAVDTMVSGSQYKTWGDYVKDRPSQALQTLYATLTMGGAVGSLGVARQQFDKLTGNHKAAVDGLFGHAILDGVMEAAASTPLRTTSPENFAKFVDEGAANSPVKNVFIPIEAIDKVLADETVPEEEKAALSLYQSQIEDARLNQSEVVIPIGEAMSTFAGTKMWDGIRDDSRVVAGGISAREARVHMDSLITNLETIGQQAIDEAHTESPTFEGKSKVYEDVKAQVLSAGRSEKEAKTTGALLASRAENLASDRYGQFKTVDDAWKWMQLEIKGKNDTARKARGDPAQSNTVQQSDGLRGKSGVLEQPSGSFLGTNPIEGAPTQLTIPGRGKVAVQAHPAARQAAADYMAGQDYSPPTHYTKVDTERATRIANAFDQMEHAPSNPEVKASYAAMIKEVLAQYQAIKKTGLKIEFIKEGQDDPYLMSPRLAILDAQENNHLWVFPTEGGFGQGEVTDSPMLQPTKEKIDGHTLLVNDVFRIVHDYFGHIKDGHGFRADGEENAWQSHAAMFSPLARRAMTTETRGQNSWLNYGPHGTQNRTASSNDTVYAEQKVGLLPQWASEEGRAIGPTTLQQSAVPEGYESMSRHLTDDEKHNMRNASKAKLMSIIETLPNPEEMAAVALSGRAKLGWYENSARAIQDVFGSADAPRFAALLAALSPQTSVESNLYNALKVWTNWNEAGRPTERKAIVKVMGSSVQGGKGVGSILSAWINNSVTALSHPEPGKITLSGPKVDSFMNNLVGVVDEVTNDAWMANYANVDQVLFKKTGQNKGPGYKAMNAVVRQAAEILKEKTGEGWSPAEVQETVWSFAKTLYETRNAKGENRDTEAVLRAGGVTHDDIANTPDFAVLFADGIYKTILEKGGYNTEGLGSDRRAVGVDGTQSITTVPKGSGFTQAAFEDFLSQAARRLEAVRIRRRDGEEDANGFPLEDGLSSQGDGTLDPTDVQTYQQGPRGEATFYPSGKTVVQLFGKADFSTMLHEMSHVFLQQEFILAQHPDASPELKADVAALTKWMESNGGAIENGIPNTHGHELFARTGERYFREGNAPSPELRSAFTQFKNWLSKIYGSIKSIGSAPITPEIREIMDRMIATKDAIDTNATMPMSQEDLGMSEAEYNAYIDAFNSARGRAFDTLLERMMKAIRSRETQKGREHRANVRAEVAKEVNARPEFIALHLLRTGRWLGQSERERTPVKINTGWLIDNYGEDVLKQLPVGLQPIHNGEGLIGDEIADMVGMPSGDALVKALLLIKSQAAALKAAGNPRPLRDQIIEDETNKRIGDDVAMSEEAIKEEAIAALNSAAQGELLATELRQLRKKNAAPGVVTPYQMLREWARRKVSQGTVADAVSKSALQRYIRGYNKARTAFENALLDNKPDEAIKAKQAQMINHALLAEGKVVADEINVIVRRMQRYARTKAMASIDQDYMDRVHELLEGYSFRNVADIARAQKASFEEWAKEQQAQGQEVHVPERFRDDRTNWKDANVSKLLELNDMVQSIVALGKLKQSLKTAQGERELAATIDEAEGRILNLPERNRGDSSVGETFKPFMQSVREGDYRAAVTNLFRKPSVKAREIAAGLIKVEGMFDILDGTKDGTGPLNQTVLNGSTAAANKFSSLMEEVMKPIIARYKAMEDKVALRLNDFVTINELTLNVSIHEDDQEKIGKPLNIPRRQLIGLLLNTGNQSNLEKLVAGEKWGDPGSATDLARVRDTLLKYANKGDMELVQGIWDGVAKLWPHIAEVEREMSGIVPEKVVNTEFDHEGQTYSGGYWPVVYDSTRSEMGKATAEQAESSLLGAGYGIATPKGHTITRTGAVAPMEWTFEKVLFSHTTKVISRIAYAPWIRDSLKIVNNRRITGAIRQKFGGEYVAMIKPWMKDQIPANLQDVPGAKFLEKWINQARINMSISVLGVSYTTGISQTLGLGYSAGFIGEGNVKDGAKWVGYGMTKMLQLQKKGASGAQEFVFARSQEMQRRAHEVNQESAEVFRRLRDTDTAYHKMQAAAFWHIGFIDMNMVSIPTWLGAYHKALSNGLTDEEASNYGDKAVRMSQGSGRAKDLSAVQRGNAGQKFMAMFYTPSSVFFNSQWDAVQQIKAGNWSKALAPTFWFLTASTIADAMMNGDWPDDPDQDGLGGMDISRWIARNMMFGLFYGIPVARDIANTSERLLTGRYAEYGTTPLSYGMQAIGRGIQSGMNIAKTGEVTGTDLKREVQAIGFLMGLPGNQVGKAAGYVKDVHDGKADGNTAGDWFTGLTSGTPQKPRS